MFIFRSVPKTSHSVSTNISKAEILTELATKHFISGFSTNSIELGSRRGTRLCKYVFPVALVARGVMYRVDSPGLSLSLRSEEGPVLRGLRTRQHLLQAHSSPDNGKPDVVGVSS